MLAQYGDEEDYMRLKKTKRKFFILLNNYEGGSFKFINDIFDTYDNNYIVIDNVEEINHIQETDYLIINYCNDTFINKILKEKKKNFKVIVNLHDFYWFGENYNIEQNTGVYKNYLNC